MNRRDFFKGAACSALCMLGCGSKDSFSSGDNEETCVLWPQSAPRIETFTPGGIRLLYPNWLQPHPELLNDAILEIDTTVAQNGMRTLLDPVAIGYTVIIGNPGAIELAESPTGLVAGFHCATHKVIVVAWRFPNKLLVLLPALSHEIGHVFGGQNANHDGAGCPECAVLIE